MLKHFIFVFILSVFSFAQEIPVPKGEFSPKKYVCYNSGEALTIDGKLDESAWNKTGWTDDFVDIEGALKTAPRFITRAKMLWDNNYFYIAAEIHEPDIWGTLKNRDDIIFFDNDFEIFIDPDGDTHGYTEFEMNALNTIWDLFLIQPYRDIDKAALNGWDIKDLKTGTAIYGTLNNAGDKDSCWTVEVAFPWKAFSEITETETPPEEGDQWRINFSRVEWKTEIKDGNYQKVINPETGKSYPEDNWVWSPQGVVNMHYPEMWGYVQFTSKVVGTGKISFADKKEETAKWFLRQIYYAERNYFAKNLKFTKSIKKLKIAGTPVCGFILPPVIDCTSNMFEAYLQSVKGDFKIHINNSGLVWISQLKK